MGGAQSLTQDNRVLLSHVEDLCARAERGEVVATAFLTPGEQRDVIEQLRSGGHAHRARFWGGYAEAERCCLFLFPDFATETVGPDGSVGELLAFCGEEDPLCVLHLQGSGFCTLTHRDYLGSLLALGLEREVLGDILTEGEHGAYVFCRTTLAGYVETLERVGRDRICIDRIPADAAVIPKKETRSITDTVASARLDCIVAALANASRDVAQSAIRDGRVELDYRTEQRVDRTVEAPAIISVRGVGKFRVLSVSTPTKKGRYRLLAEKYV